MISLWRKTGSHMIKHGWPVRYFCSTISQLLDFYTFSGRQSGKKVCWLYVATSALIVLSHNDRWASCTDSRIQTCPSKGYNHSVNQWNSTHGWKLCMPISPVVRVSMYWQTETWDWFYYLNHWLTQEVTMGFYKLWWWCRKFNKMKTNYLGS